MQYEQFQLPPRLRSVSIMDEALGPQEFPHIAEFPPVCDGAAGAPGFPVGIGKDSVIHAEFHAAIPKTSHQSQGIFFYIHRVSKTDSLAKNRRSQNLCHYRPIRLQVGGLCSQKRLGVRQSVIAKSVPIIVMAFQGKVMVSLTHAAVKQIRRSRKIHSWNRAPLTTGILNISIVSKRCGFLCGAIKNLRTWDIPQKTTEVCRYARILIKRKRGRPS